MKYLFVSLLAVGCVSPESGKLAAQRLELDELRQMLMVQNAELEVLKERLVEAEEELSMLLSSPLECVCYAGEAQFD